MNCHLSHHAEQRMSLRGIRAAAVDAILQNFDVDHSVGGGCRVLRLSRSAAQDAALAIGMPSIASGLAGLALIENETTGKIVTVLRDLGGPQGRRYRRAR